MGSLLFLVAVDTRSLAWCGGSGGMDGGKGRKRRNDGVKENEKKKN